MTYCMECRIIMLYHKLNKLQTDDAVQYLAVLLRTPYHKLCADHIGRLAESGVRFQFEFWILVLN